MKLVVIFLSAILLAAVAQAAPEVVHQGAEPFAGYYYREHADSLDAARRAQLDTLNRTLREAAGQVKEAKDDTQRQAAADKSATATTQLSALLQELPALPLTWQPGGAVLDAVAPVTLDGPRGALLFRIAAGDGPEKFTAARFDFSQHSSYRLQVPLETGGTTWLLLSLINVPHLTTHWELELTSTGAPSIILPIDLTTPAGATLRLTVLSDDTGKPCPAMVRIERGDTHQAFRPANAVEFSSVFDRQGNYQALRRTNYPGALAGGYWCVPGPLEMELPPGAWELTVLRGLEHVPVQDRFSLVPGEAIKREYRPARWEDMRRHGWYSGDDHVHGQILNDADAKTLMAWIQAEDVHLANVVKMGDIYRTWFDQRGFGPNYRVVQQDYILSPGQECPRTHNELGHTLHMNIKNMIRDTSQYYLYDRVFNEVQEQGGLSGYAHVNSGIFNVHRDMSLNIPKEKVDFVELLQFTDLGTDIYYDFLNLGFQVTASAGSDVPWGGTVGEVRVFAHTGRHHFTADRWFAAVDAGHTFVTNGVLLDLRVNRAWPGDEVTIKNDRPLRVKARAWGDARRLTPTKLEIVSQGEVVKTVEAGPGREEITIDFDLPVGNGCWIAARAEGSDGSRAHTTPIYAVRPGYRFWKLEQAEALIDKRLTSLAEIEGIVAEAEAKAAAGELKPNRVLRELAEDGPALLERVTAARSYYEGLKKTAEDERSLKHQPEEP